MTILVPELFFEAQFHPLTFKTVILVPKLTFRLNFILEDDRFSPQTLHFGLNFIHKVSKVYFSL
jgi:hypothetical protein